MCTRGRNILVSRTQSGNSVSYSRHHHLRHSSAGRRFVQTWETTCSLTEHKVASHSVFEPDASSSASFVNQEDKVCMGRNVLINRIKWRRILWCTRHHHLQRSSYQRTGCAHMGRDVLIFSTFTTPCHCRKFTSNVNRTNRTRWHMEKHTRST